MDRFYCYGPHRPVIVQLLRRLGANPMQLRAVDDGSHLAGIDGGFMFDVYGHPRPIPAEVREAVEQRGMVWIRHDDSPARAKPYALRREHGG